jgi:hypothetical protein
MSFENLLNNVQVVPNPTPTVPTAREVVLGQRTVAVGKDIRIVSSVRIGGAEISVLASGQNGNTKCWMPLMNAAGKYEYAYLGEDIKQARSNAQALFRANKVSKSEAVQGNLVALKFYTKPSPADAALLGERKARDEGLRAEIWRNHRDLTDQWIAAISGNTPEDRRYDERRKEEDKKDVVKAVLIRSEQKANDLTTIASADNSQGSGVPARVLTVGDKYRVAVESIVSKVIAVADGKMTKSEALSSVSPELAGPLEKLIDSANVSVAVSSNKKSAALIGAENQRFAFIVGNQTIAGIQPINPLNVQHEASAA